LTVSRSNARTLRKVVPIAQCREAGGITVALSALELYEGGEGVLRYLISHDPKKAFEYGGPEPEVEIRDGSGRLYGWGLEGYGGGEGETEGTLEVFDLPDSGDLEVRVLRVVRTGPPDGAVGEAREGPWEFRLSL
jgi:hypothetical protein